MFLVAARFLIPLCIADWFYRSSPELARKPSTASSIHHWYVLLCTLIVLALSGLLILWKLAREENSTRSIIFRKDGVTMPFLLLIKVSTRSLTWDGIIVYHICDVQAG